MGIARTVLIIDDDPAFSDFLRAAVESVGHRTRLVSSGAEAMAAFAACKPDLVMLDLLLPQRDGFKICQDIRATPEGRDLPIVMMTGIYKKATHEREGLEKHRASAYLYKPFGVRETWGLLERFLGGCGSADEAADARACDTSLTDTPLACVLAERLERRDDGVLFVRGPESTTAIYLRAGSPVFARSNHPEDRLDRILLRTGQVSDEVVRTALVAVADARGRTRLGGALREMGAITAEQLGTALQLQIQLLITRAFQFPSGRCLFIAGEHPTEEDVLLATSAAAVIFRGSRVTGSTPAVRRWLPPSSATLVRSPGWKDALKDLTLRDVENHLLQLADGECTVERFLSIASMAEIDGPRALLAMTSAGLLQVADAAAENHAQSEHFVDWRWKGQSCASAFLELHRLGATGLLAVGSDRGPTRTIALRGGHVVGCHSTSAEDRLAESLARLQVIDDARLTEVLQTVGGTDDDLRIQREACARGFLSPSDMYWVRVYQSMQAVLNAFGSGESVEDHVPQLAWTPGLPPDFAVLPDVATSELAWEAARCLAADEVESMLPDGSTLVASAPGAGDKASRMPMRADECALLEALEAPITISALVAQAADPDLTRRALCGLIATGLVGTLSGARSEDAHEESDSLMSLHDASDEAAEPRREDSVLGSAEPDFLDMLGTSHSEPARASVPPPPPAAALEGTPAPLAECARNLADIASRMRGVRPVIRTLRTGLSGDQRRVEVDRASMAELLDALLALVNDACRAQGALSSALAASAGEVSDARREEVQVGGAA